VAFDKTRQSGERRAAKGQPPTVKVGEYRCVTEQINGALWKHKYYVKLNAV
jgi:hypothetical protein